MLHLRSTVIHIGSKTTMNTTSSSKSENARGLSHDFPNCHGSEGHILDIHDTATDIAAVKDGLPTPSALSIISLQQHYLSSEEDVSSAGADASPDMDDSDYCPSPAFSTYDLISPNISFTQANSSTKPSRGHVRVISYTHPGKPRVVDVHRTLSPERRSSNHLSDRTIQTRRYSLPSPSMTSPLSARKNTGDFISSNDPLAAARFYRTDTADLADFLRNTGPTDLEASPHEEHVTSPPLREPPAPPPIVKGALSVSATELRLFPAPAAPSPHRQPLPIAPLDHTASTEARSRGRFWGRLHFSSKHQSPSDVRMKQSDCPFSSEDSPNSLSCQAPTVGMGRARSVVKSNKVNVKQSSVVTAGSQSSPLHDRDNNDGEDSDLEREALRLGIRFEDTKSRNMVSRMGTLRQTRPPIPRFASFHDKASKSTVHTGTPEVSASIERQKGLPSSCMNQTGKPSSGVTEITPEGVQTPWPVLSPLKPAGGPAFRTSPPSPSNLERPPSPSISLYARKSLVPQPLRIPSQSRRRGVSSPQFSIHKESHPPQLPSLHNSRNTMQAPSQQSAQLQSQEEQHLITRPMRSPSWPLPGPSKAPSPIRRIGVRSPSVYSVNGNADIYDECGDILEDEVWVRQFTGHCPPTKEPHRLPKLNIHSKGDAGLQSEESGSFLWPATPATQQSPKKKVKRRPKSLRLNISN